jgi:hypothetical protein
MYRMRRSASAVTFATALVGLSLSAVLACAQERQPVRPAVVRLTPAKDAADSVNLILTRSRPVSIPADTMFDTLPGVGDDQRLMVGTNCPGDCRYGPRAKIQPHRAASYLTQADRDSGVVIARIINLDTLAYAKFNLHGRDTVYWWVGRQRGQRVSVFISSYPGRRPWVSNLAIDEHSSTSYTQPLARWLWNDRDEEAWGTCDGGRCCRSNGQELFAER